MIFLHKTVMIIIFFMLSALIFSCDSNTTVTTTITTSITTSYPYPEELYELYDLELYDVSIIEVNDGSTNIIYVLKNKDNSSIESYPNIFTKASLTLINFPSSELV